MSEISNKIDQLNGKTDQVLAAMDDKLEQRLTEKDLDSRDQEAIDSLDRMQSMLKSKVGDGNYPNYFWIKSNKFISFYFDNRLWLKDIDLEYSYDRVHWVKTKTQQIIRLDCQTIWFRGTNNRLTVDLDPSADNYQQSIYYYLSSYDYPKVLIGGDIRTLANSDLDVADYSIFSSLGRFSCSCPEETDGFYLSDDFVLPRKLVVLSNAFSGFRIESPPEIPQTVESMDQAFYRCKDLKKLPKLPPRVENVKLCFYDCRSINEIPDGYLIPETIKNFQGFTYGICFKRIGNNVKMLADMDFGRGYQDAFDPNEIEEIGDNFELRNSTITDTDPFRIFPNLKTLGTNCNINGTVTNPVA